MKKYIITIARQFGSGGRMVGQKLAELLGYDFYDKSLITLSAQKSGIESGILAGVDEKPVNSLLYTLALGSSMYNNGNEQIALPINDRLFVIQSNIIKDAAEKGNGAVIVGRCADYVLSERDDVVRVFISSDFPNRVKTVMERHDLTEQKAKDAVIKTDRRRSNYYSYYTGEKWGKIDRYDLVVSTDKLGIEGAARVIKNYVEQLDEITE